jgi:hypothetical protein
MPEGNGDADCDGQADAIDAFAVLAYDAALVSGVACPLSADVNQNARIDSLDATLILQFTAGLISGLPL